MTLEGKEIVFTRITWGELSSVQVIYLINYEIQRRRNYTWQRSPEETMILMGLRPPRT